MRGMDSHETSVRKRRNREHHNSRNGCLQCKARKVKVWPLRPRNMAAAHSLCYSATKKNLSAEAALGELHHVHTPIALG